jgi:hypothetical protein
MPPTDFQLMSDGIYRRWWWFRGITGDGDYEKNEGAEAQQNG